MDPSSSPKHVLSQTRTWAASAATNTWDMNMDQPDRKYFNPDGSTNFFARDGAYVGTFFGNNGVEEAYVSRQIHPLTGRAVALRPVF